MVHARHTRSNPVLRALSLDGYRENGGHHHQNRHQPREPLDDLGTQTQPDKTTHRLGALDTVTLGIVAVGLVAGGSLSTPLTMVY